MKYPLLVVTTVASILALVCFVGDMFGLFDDWRDWLDPLLQGEDEEDEKSERIEQMEVEIRGMRRLIILLTGEIPTRSSSPNELPADVQSASLDEDLDEDQTFRGISRPNWQKASRRRP
ncbi:hypothetical protein F5B22DRAFT_643718 [Xylaria bambusicola]|uniref:uncharacterized protein n=1 Tax=Xylaria bambusicola TaxID=326684 RepID=UPI002008712E|nr:uncharacterized protein F5B22DRAFT_643718 [Xylaria bambusicola]KAI0521551.1 hypothetical protein F5B22DRAFT_643718 [Xylaria bambusicola]